MICLSIAGLKMHSCRSRIYISFIVLWGLCAVVLGIQAGLYPVSVADASAALAPGADMSTETSIYSIPCIAEHAEPFSVLIYREAKGKRKLEPRADCSEWQVIYRWALMAC